MAVVDTEPFLVLLHGHALGEEHRGAVVAQVVEAYLLQLMLFQQLSEVLESQRAVAC